MSALSLEQRAVPKAPDQIPDNIAFTAQELLEAPAEQREAMLEKIAMALTRRLLKENPGIGARAISQRVARYVRSVREPSGRRSG